MDFIPFTEIDRYYSKAKCLLNTSKFEGFSNTFLEAWCAGTPVITKKSANPDNIIRKFNIGYVYDSILKSTYYINKIIDNSENGYFDSKCISYVMDHHNPNILTNKLHEFLTLHYEN